MKSTEVSGSEQYTDMRAIARELEQLIGDVTSYFGNDYNDADETDITKCLRMSFAMAYDCYIGIVSLSPHLTLSPGVLVRTMIEIRADMNFIHKDKTKQQARATKYMHSVETYTRAMIKAAQNMSQGKAVDVKHPNPWTSSQINQRIEQLGDIDVLLYDYFSVFTHANPAIALHATNKLMQENAKVTAVRAAIIGMLNVIGIMVMNEITIDACKWVDISDRLRAYDKKYPSTF